VPALRCNRSYAARAAFELLKAAAGMLDSRTKQVVAVAAPEPGDVGKAFRCSGAGHFASTSRLGVVKIRYARASVRDTAESPQAKLLDPYSDSDSKVSPVVPGKNSRSHS